MELNRTSDFQAVSGFQHKPSFMEMITGREETAVKDKVSLGGDQFDKLAEDLGKMKDLSAGYSTQVVKFPQAGQTQNTARNETPVVIVHGTMATQKSIEKYGDGALQTGHPADLTTYMTIKEGEHLQKSGQIVSRNVNEDRMQVTQKHLNDLLPIKNDAQALQSYFGIDENLYNGQGQNVDSLMKLIPGVIGDVANLMVKNREELLGSFSTHTKMIEDKLAKDLKKSGFADSESDPKKKDLVCSKTAAEVMDTVSPKAVLLGHSMGGFVSYTIAMNPKTSLSDKNEFAYDAGNGVSTVITLSSPVAKGVTAPLPRGLANLSYDILDKTMLAPMEGMPGMQFAMLNPFFKSYYDFSKSMTRETLKLTSNNMTTMTNPMTYMQKPGVQQISEGSDFIKKYVQGKSIPEGMTVIAVSNREDGISEQENSVVDEKYPNAHNLDAEVTITAEDLKPTINTRPSLAHVKMASYPFEHGEEFKKEILEDPSHIKRLLEPANYDGIRFRCLSVLQENLNANPQLLETPEYKGVKEKLQDVAAEKLPFKDSPSYLAHQILEGLKA
ncbi:MAG: GPI inositol-deacylase [Firmicutes bacterium]|nr:GPI inositol-deacylase [Bacillota bacterium]